ncbi:MAG: transposase [Leptospiraceae bacterium]|nr:transposase [Leptospiraceae bacterium]
MIKRKNFSNEFKEKIVLEYTSGQSSAAQIAQREGITSQTVRDWGNAFNNKKFQSMNSTEFSLRKRVAELESALAEASLTIHILKKKRGNREEIQYKRKIIQKYLAPEFGVKVSCKEFELGLSSYYYSSDFKERKRERDSKIVKKLNQL